MTYLSSREVRARLNISRSTLERLIKQGDIKASKIGNGRTSHFRIAETDLQDYLDRQAVKVVTP